MNTNQDLETQLRASLTARAQDITHAPHWTPTAPVPASPGWRSPRVWAPLAAAACVGALVAGILIGRSDDSATPAHPSPSPSPTVAPTGTPTGTPTPTTSPSPTNALTTSPNGQQVAPASCVTTIPEAWKSAVAAAPIDLGSPTPATTTAFVVGSAPGGGFLVTRDDGPSPGSGREVVLVKPGQAAKVLYSVADPDRYGISSADISGKWLVVGVQIQARLPRNTIGGNTPNAIDAVVLVDISTGASHTLVASPDYGHAPSASEHQLTIVNDVVFNGKVYWDERPSYAATNGTVKSYDLTSGTTQTVFSGPSGYVSAIAGGVLLDPQGIDKLLVPASLPPVVDGAMTKYTRTHLNSDGTAYAWNIDATTVGWWRPGLAKPSYLRLPNGLDTDDNGGAPLVAGDYVSTFQGGQSEELTNMVTGASAVLPDSAFPYSRGQVLWGNDGVFSVEVVTASAGHYVNGYWLDAPWGVLTLNTASLPKLSC